MKKITILTCMLTIAISGWSMQGPGLKKSGINVISTSYDMFYFKADKSILGAQIEVYNYQTGKKVLTQTLDNKRAIIDLHFQHPGDYIILITKGDFKRKFVFHKKSSTPYLQLDDTIDNTIVTAPAPQNF